MKLLYLQEHLRCFNYEASDRPLIEKVSLKKEDKWNMSSLDNKIIFIVDGKIRFSYGEYSNREITSNKIVLLPSGNNFKSEILEDSFIFVFRLRMKVQLCDIYSLDKLEQEGKKDIKDLYFLEINKKVSLFLKSLEMYIDDGLKCFYFYQSKLTEFFFIFRAYYQKNDLLNFFQPLLSSDISFSDFVIKNHRNVKNVKEFAELANYSLSGFQKRFKKVFGVSSYQWMKEQRSKSIFHEINNSDKTFKEISNDYGFSSPSHFNDFCKAHFGSTPGEIRKNT